MRIERAEYGAALAERRYQEYLPANPLVAGTLERRWNEAMLHVEAITRQKPPSYRVRAPAVATSEQKAQSDASSHLIDESYCQAIDIRLADLDIRSDKPLPIESVAGKEDIPDIIQEQILTALI